MNKVLALGEALLDAVLPRRKPQEWRQRRPDQPANSFINRSGELASDMSRVGLAQTDPPAVPPSGGGWRDSEK